VTGVCAAENAGNPFRRALFTGDEAFCAEEVGGGVEGAGEGVDCDYVGRFFVPGAVFAPVGGGDFGPGVGEVVGCGEDFHCFVCVDVCV